MRKWMSDRLKRRKKGGDKKSAEKASTPAPLQPKYFENELAQPETQPAAVEAESLPEPLPAQADSPAEDVPVADDSGSSATAPSPASRRRRRGRGGRGRGRGGKSKPADSTPPAADSSASEPAVAEPPVPIPAPAAAAPAPSTKGTVVLAIGLPGSGKSSWFKRHNILPLSSDMLRQLLFDDSEEQRFQDLVFSNLRSMLKARLIARRPTSYVDATNLTPHDRHSWIKLARDFGYDVQGVFFDVPLEVCLERNHKRSRKVSDDIMRRMSAKLKPPAFEEGFSKITVVRVKQKEAEQAEN
jgi:predicted kinase